MIIKKIDIIGYGKWRKQEFNVSQKLQIIQGRNESGKSTLRAFIEHMLFGFPKKIEGHYRYEPLTGEVMGGRLWLEQTLFGDIMVERFLKNGKISEKMVTAEGRELTLEEWQQVLGNLTQKQYQQVFAFNEQELQQLQLQSQEEIDRYLYSVSLSGSDRYLQVEQQLRKRAEQQFTPRASKKELNIQLQQLDAAWKQVQKGAQQNNDYQQLVQELQQVAEQQEQLQQQLEQSHSRLQYYHKLAELWPMYQQYRELHQREWVDKLEWQREWESDIEKLVLEQEWLQSTLITQQQLLEQLQNEEQLKAQSLSQQAELQVFVQQNRMKIEQLVTHIQKNAEHLQQLSEEIQLEERFWQVDHEQLPPALTRQEQEQLQNWSTLIAQAKQEQQQLIQKDQLIQEQQGRLITNYSSTTEKYQPPGWLSILLLIVAVLIAILPGSLVVKLGSLIAMGGVFWYWWTRGNNQQKRWHFAQEEWQHLERERLDIQEKQEYLVSQMQVLQQQQNNWYQDSVFASTAITLEELRKEDPLQVLRQLDAEWKMRLEKERQQKAEFQLFAAQWQWYWEVSSTVPPEKMEQQWKIIRTYIEKSQNFHQTEVVRYQEINALQQQILDLQTRIYQVERDITNVLQQAQVATVEDFWNKSMEYQEQQALEQQKEQYEQLLQSEWQQLSFFEDEGTLRKQIQQLENQSEELQKNYHQSLKKLARLQEKKEQFEQNVDYQEALIHYQLLKDDIQQQVIQWSSNHYAAEWLMDSLQAYIPTKQSAILQDAGNFLARLTNQRYYQLQFNEEKLQILRNDGVKLDVTHCSRGTIDQIYVALRLSFIKNLQSSLQLPVLIDDGFVNFDTERKQMMLELLQELSDKVQILYFSLDDDILHEYEEVIRLSQSERGEVHDKKII